MSNLNSHLYPQHTGLVEFARNVLRAAMMPSPKTVQREMRAIDYSTEMLRETGTTDAAIGDVTAEIMITTTGKIPSEMYYLEDTTPLSSSTASNNSTASGFHNHSTIFLVLSIALLILLLLCCITACIIAKGKRRNFFNKNDIECYRECRGIHQPLLSSEKLSDTSKSSDDSSMKN